MRITINTVIFRYLCHLALDHWGCKTILFLCDSWKFSVICKPLKFFGVILSDLWITAIFGGHFSVIHEPPWIFWGNSLWFSVICEPLWNFSGDTQTILNYFWGNSWWFVNHCDIFSGNSEWFTNHSEMFLGQFLLICKPLWNFLGAILGDSQTTLKRFTIHSDFPNSSCGQNP